MSIQITRHGEVAILPPEKVEADKVDEHGKPVLDPKTKKPVVETKMVAKPNRFDSVEEAEELLTRIVNEQIETVRASRHGAMIPDSVFLEGWDIYDTADAHEVKARQRRKQEEERAAREAKDAAARTLAEPPPPNALDRFARRDEREREEVVNADTRAGGGASSGTTRSRTTTDDDDEDTAPARGGSSSKKSSK